MASQDTFALDVSRFCQRTKGDVRTIIGKIALVLLRKVVLRTPVDTGRLRGNWMLSLFNLTYQSDWNLFDRSGGSTIARAADTLKALKQATGPISIWLANHLPYAIPIEYGWSKKSPQGMARISIIEVASATGAELTEVEDF